MDVREVTYTELTELPGGNFRLFRTFRDWRAFDGGKEDYLIIIDDFRRRRAIVFSYESRRDRDADVELLRSIPDDGREPPGVTAMLRPDPPSRAGSTGQPFPPESRDGGWAR